MKRSIYILMMLSLLLSSASAFAAPPEFSGGVKNEYEYKEVVFITGKPITLTGKVDVAEKDKDTTKTTSYKFTLENKDLGAKLERKIDLITTFDKRSDKGQTIANTEISKATESLKIGNDKYDLMDFQFSKSDVIDNRPASDFYSGNIKGRKHYTINKDQGEVNIDITGADVGYKNFWGASETQMLTYNISSSRKGAAPSSSATPSTGTATTAVAAAPTVTSWEGSVNVEVSDSLNKILQYSDNEASFSSFNGGHMRITNEDMVSSYEYNLPKIENNALVANKREINSIKLSKSISPKLERLILPKFRDLGGHWAQEDIEKLYSLDVFDNTGTFFAPDVSINRADFIKAVIKACDIRTSFDAPKPKTTSKKIPPEVSIFSDMDVKDESYKYVKGGVEKGIVTGEGDNKFKPSSALTRAQAITIMIRALGFENKAPAPDYTTSFSDDRSIPSYAKDAIYMAREVGLIQGDSLNKVNPNKVMSKAEASAMLVRFLEFLQKDLKRDYRENIILFSR